MPVSTYSVTFTGRVQDIGFRDLVEKEAQTLGIRGIVYNRGRDRVQVLCQGIGESVQELVEGVEKKAPNLDADVGDIEMQEIAADVPDLPTFTKVQSETLGDIGRKLDDGVDVLRSLDEGQGELVEGQRELVEGQREMIDVLKERL